MNSQKGFTLIELLIVIAIIAVLAVALLPTLLGAPAKARDTQRTTQIQKISGFLLSQSLAGKSLPADSACVDPAGVANTIGELVNKNVADFAGTFPKDPKADNVTTGATPVCTGLYGYVKFDSATAKKYTSAVYAAVEVLDNANIKCKDIKAAADPVLTPKTVTLVSGEVGCMLVPIQ
ncbi:type II secretion system protein [Candidatus Gracilibacteria bacterium]|nr:type II secretion system protein [Candidatus Gracilibacteria bacterium]